MTNSANSFCGNSTFWDSAALTNNSYPEFTRCFQQTSLTYVPCAWLWITGAIHLLYLKQHQQFVILPVTWLSVLRLLFVLMLSIVSGLHMLVPLDSDVDADTYPPSFFLSQSLWAATYLLAFVLMVLSQRSGVTSPCVVFLFWMITLVANIVPVYVLAMEKNYEHNLANFCLVCTTFVLIVAEFGLQCVGDINVYLLDSTQHGKPCTMVKSSFVSRITFSWVFSLVYTGYKKSVVLSDVFDLPHSMQCHYIVPHFLATWMKELRKKKPNIRKNQQISHTKENGSVLYRNGQVMEIEPTERTYLLSSDDGTKVRNRKPSLYKVLIMIFYLPLFKSQFVGLLGDCLLFLNPVLLDEIIDYAEHKELHPVWQGYVLAVSFFIITFVQSMTNNYRMYTSINIGMKAKTVLTAAVYKKALTMNAESRRKFTVGTIVNLMAVDCPSFQELAIQLYSLIAFPIQMSIAFYMLYNEVGIAFVAGMVVLLLLVPANAGLSTLTKRVQTKQIILKDQRLKLMNEILNGVKVLKLYAWEPSFQAKLTQIRQAEIVQLKKSAIYQSVSTLCWLLSPVLVTLLTFIAYVLITQESLTPNKAFVAMNLFNIIRQPMNSFPMLISQLIQCYVSMGRLTNFLSGEDLLENDSLVSSDEYPLVMKNATYTWDRTMEPVLKNISVSFPKGKLIAVVGPVGAGKSSLLSAFLGEMEKLHGQGSMQGSIGYVPQQAWIQNMTFRSNILFHQPMKESRYKKIIKACALESDVELLPGGELTEIGEKGINLSGGQKQRVSLARAVYQNADVYLLDDPLSAVDAHVGKRIFEKVIGPKGMIRKKTRVLVTHGIHWLPLVDQIVVMDQGQITELGTYEQLMSHNGPFAEFVRTYLLEHEDEEIDDPEVQMLKEQVLEQVAAVTSDDEFQQVRLRRSLSSDQREHKSDNVLQHSQNSLSSSMSTQELTPKLTTQPKDGDSQNSRLIEEEKSEQGKVKNAIFIAFLRAFGYFCAAMVTVSLILYNGFNVASGIYLSAWTDDPFLKNESNTGTDSYTSKTYMYLGIYTLLSLLQVIGNCVFVLLVYVQFVNASQRLHNSMLNTILHQPMSFFDTTPVGRILNRFSREVDVLDVGISRQVRLTLHTLSNLISIIVVISYSTPIFIAVVVPITICYILFQKFYISSSRQIRRLESTTRSPIFSHFGETINGASSIRAYRVQEKFFHDSLVLVDTNNQCFFASLSAGRWLRVRLELLGNLIVLFAGLFAVISDSITGSLVGLSMSYALQVTAALTLLIQNMTQMETNFVSIERIIEYTNLPHEPAWTNVNKQPPIDWPYSGSVVFENYSTRYRPHLELVLKSVSFKVNAHEKIGIVGRTGAGKSSLSLALFRMIEAAGGHIFIDDLNIHDMGLHDLRNKLTILPQDPVLFSGSVRFNLDPFEIHSDEALWMALKNAHLSDFVREMPGQLEYMCEEGGQNLSVGQRQLMCLARSLLRKTKILILDEATAAVDLETDFLLQNTIREAFRDCTVLTVAHRLQTVIDYDKILVLSNGEVIEFDTPEKLLANKSGMFYSMAKESSLVQ
ncbi:hypothetical protein BsWGS_20635 [Bradybaena similaris]